VSAASLIRYVYLAHFSRPAHERRIYRTIRRNRASNIVEIGVQMGRRASRLIRVAARYAGKSDVRYTGIDLFEARGTDQPGLTLKKAHRTLTALGAKVQLIPGDSYSALARSANTLTGTDLVVISADQDLEALSQSWFYMPRMLHQRSRVFVEVADLKRGKPGYWELDLGRVAELAGDATVDVNRAA